MSVTELRVIGAASTTPNYGEAVTENTLAVVGYPGEDVERIYWKGERLDGTIDHTKPMARSTTHPFFTMMIEGESITFGSSDATTNAFEFRGETLYVYGGGFPVSYDEEADRPVF